MYAFISRYWDGRGAVWNRVTVLVHLKVVYAAVEMLLPQTRHCLQAYISAQQRALTKTQRSCPSSWNSCMKSLTTCMGSQVSASWLAQTEREKDTSWHAPGHPSHLAHSVRKCPVFQTHGLDCLQSLMVVHGYLGFFTIREVLWLGSPETRSFDHLCFLSSPQCMLAIPSPRS